MRKTSRRLIATPLIAAAAVAMLAGCGSSSSGASGEVAPAHLARVGHGLSVVLTPLGLSRIGLQTATVTSVAGQTIIPFQALLYEPNGQTAVYVRTGPLTFTARFITVSSINGDQVFVSQGLTPGTVVVTQGAEELLGVQDGVGVET